MRPTTIWELLERYFGENLIDASPLTRHKYAVVLRHFERIHRTTSIDELSNERVSKLMSVLLGEGCCRVTVNGYRAKLCAMWTWACKQGWLTKWPSVRKLPTPKRAPVAWSPREIQHLWGCLSQVPGAICSIPAPLWWRAYLAIALDTGERHGARMALKWEHFTEFDGGTGMFPYGIRKGEVADMPFQLSPETVAILRELRALDASPFVTPWSQTPEHFFARFRQLLQACGLPSDRAHLTHCLRRYVATQLRVAGVDATAALGHADKATTDESYIDARFIQRTWPHQVLPKLDLPPDRPAA